MPTCGARDYSMAVYGEIMRYSEVSCSFYQEVLAE